MPLTGKKRDFCSHGPGSCHRRYYSEIRQAGEQAAAREESERDRLLFGKHMTPMERLAALVQAARVLKL
jgi:hypothetical protein